MQRIPRIVGRQEKSLEKFVLSPDNKWIAFLGDAGYILLCSNQVRPPVLSTASERLFSSACGHLFSAASKRCFATCADQGLGCLAQDGGQRAERRILTRLDNPHLRR